MNINHETAGEARAKIFCSLVMKEGKIKRGVLVSRMHISEQTFGREYLSYLEQYPNIKCNNREFTYTP
jgi:hypothetical protein